jgi:putative endonuclease
MGEFSDGRRVVGSEGENQAREFLCVKGYRWICSNFRTRWGEIDLIMRDGPTLVFVEVRRRRNVQFGLPEESVNRKKMRHLTLAAMVFIQRNRAHNCRARFDVVTLDEQGLRHYPDAFMTEGNAL